MSTTNLTNPINFKQIKHKTKVPLEPYKSPTITNFHPQKFTIDKETIQLLERLSLVNLDSRFVLN